MTESKSDISSICGKIRKRLDITSGRMDPSRPTKRSMKLQYETETLRTPVETR